MTIRKFQITYVTHFIFLLDIAGLEHQVIWGE